MVIITCWCNHVSDWDFTWVWFVDWSVLMDYTKPNYPEPIEGLSERVRALANVSDIYSYTGGNPQAMLSILEANEECFRKMVYARNKDIDFINVAGTTYFKPYPKGLEIMSGDFGQIIGESR
jgi:hypothetical protein